METASAQPVTVKVTGHVVQWQDNTGLIGPYIPPMQPVTATYTYDTVEPMGPNNQYNPSPTQTSIVVNIGAFTFETGSTSQFGIQVFPGVPNSAAGVLAISGFNNPPLPDGIPVDLISIGFQDPSGQWPTSATPPGGAPNITDFTNCQITVSGPFNQNYYQIVAQIDSVALVPPAIAISPTGGDFLSQQHFDAAVWLPTTGAPIATMQASVAGAPLALNFPGTCQLAPANSAARPALLCPGADVALAGLEGITQIDWQVTLTDGSSLTQSVQWNLVR
jgi:hypothetical protein